VGVQFIEFVFNVLRVQPKQGSKWNLNNANANINAAGHNTLLPLFIKRFKFAKSSITSHNNLTKINFVADV
jgi:hypothetical protein